MVLTPEANIIRKDFWAFLNQARTDTTGDRISWAKLQQSEEISDPVTLITLLLKRLVTFALSTDLNPGWLGLSD